MSIQFNDTTTYKGLVQFYEKEVGYNRGDVSGNTDLLKEFTASANVAFDDFLSIAFGPDGTWQLDDSNHTDYGIITTNLVSGQRDYTFTGDSGGNLILDVYRVLCKISSTGEYKEIYPVDVSTPDYLNSESTKSFIDGNNDTGIPSRYDKLANGILLDLIPSYDASAGLKIFINREPSYFVYTDTTKKPGVPGLLHKWFYIKPAFDYARINLPQNTITRLQLEVDKLEKQIEKEFRRRQRDVPRRLTVYKENNK